MSTMCSLSKKYLDKDKEKYIEYLDNSRYMCGNCGRLANNPKNLCRPIAIESYLNTKNNNKKIIKKLKKKIKKLKSKIKKK